MVWFLRGDGLINMNSLIAMPDLEFFLNLESEKDNQKCPHCGSKKINIVYEKAPCQHYASIRCGGCDAFKGWMEKPENTIKRNSTEEILNQLGSLWRVLNNWENNFISNMRNKKKHSPRQLEVLESIRKKYGIN